MTRMDALPEGMLLFSSDVPACGDGPGCEHHGCIVQREFNNESTRQTGSRRCKRDTRSNGQRTRRRNRSATEQRSSNRPLRNAGASLIWVSGVAISPSACSNWRMLQ